METYDLLQCIDRALDEYGTSAKQSLYFNLTLKNSAPFEEIIMADPALLLKALNEVFNDSSENVKLSIVDEIKKVFGLKKPSDSYALEDAIGIARRRLSGLTPSQLTV
jgi:hypothetical protein